MFMWPTYGLSDIQFTFCHIVFSLLGSLNWTNGPPFPRLLQNGVGWSYHAGATGDGKKLSGFLGLQVTD